MPCFGHGNLFTAPIATLVWQTVCYKVYAIREHAYFYILHLVALLYHTVYLIEILWFLLNLVEMGSHHIIK